MVTPTGNTLPDSGVQTTSIVPSIASIAVVEKVTEFPEELVASETISSIGSISGGTLSSINLSRNTCTLRVLSLRA